MRKITAGIDWNNSRVFDFLMEVLILIVVFIIALLLYFLAG